MTKQHKHPCSIARSLNLIGDSWSLLVVLEAFYGAERFSDFRTNTGIAKNILTDRLGKLVDSGILEKRPLSEESTRFGYYLTEMGYDLFPVLIALGQWGDKWAFDDMPPPLKFRDKETGTELDALRVFLKDGTELQDPASRLRVTATPTAPRAVKARFGEG